MQKYHTQPLGGRQGQFITPIYTTRDTQAKDMCFWKDENKPRQLFYTPWANCSRVREKYFFFSRIQLDLSLMTDLWILKTIQSSLSSHFRHLIPARWELLLSLIGSCPGFGQDRVNFHQNPGRGTARWADPTWPNRAGYSIPCAIMLGSGGAETHSRLGSAGSSSLGCSVSFAPQRGGEGRPRGTFVASRSQTI